MSVYGYLLLTVLTCCVGSSSASEFDSSTTSATQDGLVKLPLIPFHAQKERRRRELGLPKDFDFGETDPSLRRSRRAEETEEAEYEVGGLYQGYGTHYVDVWVGSPTPQRQTVIVDTGSGTTAFPCSGCHNCGKDHHASPFFVEADSNTFKKLSCDQCQYNGYCSGRGSANEYCRLSVSYQEGSSWSAYEALDTVYLGGPHHDALTGDKDGIKIQGLIHGESPQDAADFKFSMAFGCQTSITGLFITQLADGIMGLSNQEGSAWNQAYKQGVISSRKFSLCFSRADDATKDGSIAGALTLGGTDPFLHTTPMIYVNGFKSKGTMHGVTVRKMYVMEGGVYDASDAVAGNTHQLSISDSTLRTFNTIVDSGTTDTYFPRAIANQFNAAFLAASGISYSTKGFKIPDGDVEKLPTIIIQLAGKGGELNFDPTNPDAVPGLAGKLDSEHPNDVLLTMVPSHYIEYDPKSDTYFPRFYVSESHGAVIGANAMSGHDFLFDIVENGRIGIAKSDCDYEEFLNRTDSATDLDNVQTTEIDVEPEEDDYTPVETVESTPDPKTSIIDENAEASSIEENEAENGTVNVDNETDGTDGADKNEGGEGSDTNNGGTDIDFNEEASPGDDNGDTKESSSQGPEESNVEDPSISDDLDFEDTKIDMSSVDDPSIADDIDYDDINDEIDDFEDEYNDDDDTDKNDDYYDDHEDVPSDSTETIGEGSSSSSSSDSGDDGEDAESMLSPTSVFRDMSKDTLGTVIIGALVFVMVALGILALRRVTWRRGRVRYQPTETMDEQNHELYLDTEMQAPRTID